ncbi:MAG: PilW family protein [Thiobacillus sp.]|nr:PilW family protein [Thiobacillus sp.]
MNMANQKTTQLHVTGKSRGFGLIELMIAITIGLFLLGGIGYVYLGSRQTFRTQDDFSRIQENVRYAMDQVGVDVRMAGYSGCVNLSSIDPKNPTAMPITVIANGAPTVGLAEGMRGYDSATWTSPGTVPANWVANTGVFHVTRAEAGGVNLIGNMTATNANIQISGNPTGIVAEQAILISDCVSADLFRATNVASGTVTIAHTTSNCAVLGGVACNTSNNLSKAYGSDAEIYSVLSTTYFIGTNPAGNPALYRRQQLGTQTGAAEELVENVENIVMRFGIDTDNDFIVDSYVSASAVTNWRQVLTARLSLVFRSNSNNVATQVQPYVVEGTTVTPATTDRRLRRVATATFGLRNRLP